MKSFAATRTAKSDALASTRDSRQHLEGDLRALEKEQARVRAALGGGSALKQGETQPHTHQLTRGTTHR
mgnify:CR=1 FL=1